MIPDRITPPEELYALGPAVEIPLRNRHRAIVGHLKVDPEDAARVQAHHWHLWKRKQAVVRRITREDGTQAGWQWLARFLLPKTRGHFNFLNGDVCDLRKGNVVAAGYLPPQCFRGKQVWIPLFGDSDRPVAWTVVDHDIGLIAKDMRWHRDHYGYAHRTGQWLHHLVASPEARCEIDHINQDSLDNRRVNLRLVTLAQNHQNLRVQTRQKSSRFRGVCLVRRTGKWHAYVHVGGRRNDLGYYSTEEEADEAARRGRAKLMPFSHDGMLARSGEASP